MGPDKALMSAAIDDRTSVGLSHCSEITTTRWARASPLLTARNGLSSIGRDLRDLEVEAGATFLLGQSHYGTGNYVRAIEFFAANVAALQVHPDVTQFGSRTLLSLHAPCFLARALVEVGQFNEATRWAKQAITESERRDQPFGSTHGYFALGLTHLRQGAIAEATMALERGVGIARSRSISFFHPLLSAHLGEARRLSGRVDEGLSLLTDAQHVIAGSGRRATAWIQELLAEGYLACGRKTDAAVAAQAAFDASRLGRYRGQEARVLRILGDIAAHGSAPDFDEAMRYYRESISLAEELEMRPLIAHCHLGRGKLYRHTDNREQAQEQLATATTMYREMDMRFWLEQVEAEMGA